MSVAPGARLGPYEIVAALGAGGMGEVWKARDTRLDRVVAIKTVHAAFSERFEREARAISALNHPHICALFDVGQHDGAGYLVMEYVDGAPLKGPLPLDQALKCAAQICDALDAAHRKGIIHRDLKPDNILWAPWRTPSETPSVVFEMSAPAGERFSDRPAVSPDGRLIASVSNQTGRSSLLVRRLDSPIVRKLAGSEGTDTPSAWSPDSRYFVFVANGKLKKIDVASGPPQILCDFPAGSIPFAAWSHDGVILFTRGNQELWRVAASGGVPERVTALDPSRQENRHSHPAFLPDGRHFPYLAESGQREKNAMYVGSLDSKDRTSVLAVQRAAFLVGIPSGARFLLFEREGALLAQTFDWRSLRVTGEPFMVVEQIGTAATSFGVILGTAAYMAPEQAKGRSVDKRADIWAFGCVLYELLAGRRAFEGEDTSDALAFVPTKDPESSRLPGRRAFSDRRRGGAGRGMACVARLDCRRHQRPWRHRRHIGAQSRTFASPAGSPAISDGRRRRLTCGDRPRRSRGFRTSRRRVARWTIHRVRAGARRRPEHAVGASPRFPAAPPARRHGGPEQHRPLNVVVNWQSGIRK